MRRAAAVLAVLALLLTAGPAAARRTGSYVVIANPAWAGDTIPAGELKGIYLGRRPLAPGGGTVRMCTMTYTSEHAHFVRDVTGMTPRQFLNHWKRAVFTGTGVPPVNFRNEEDLKAFIAGHPDAIGYIGAGSADARVKILGLKQ